MGLDFEKRWKLVWRHDVRTFFHRRLLEVYAH
jgi:hypothetical protein